MKAVWVAANTSISLSMIEDFVSDLYSPLELGFECSGKIRIDRMVAATACKKCWWIAVFPEQSALENNNTALMVVADYSRPECIELTFTHEAEGFDTLCEMTNEEFMLSLGKAPSLKATAWRTKVMRQMMEKKVLH